MFAQWLKPHPEELERDIFFQEEARAERQANLIRILYMIVWLCATVPGVLMPPPTGSASNIGTGIIWLSGALLYHVYLQRNPYHPAQKYLSTAFDMVMVGANLYLYHTDMGYSTTLKAPPYMNFMMALALSAFRFNVGLPIIGAGIAIGIYLAVFGAMLVIEPVEFGTPLELFTTPKINLVYQGYRLTYLLMMAVLMIILVTNVRRLVGLRVEEAEQKLREQQKRVETLHVLERYFTSDIAAYVLANPQTMGGEELNATVLISDLRGFTSIAESLSPVEALGLLNRVFSHLTQIVFKYGGTLDKFMGDGMLVVFGTPVPKPGDAKRAVMAAQEMVESIDQLREEEQLPLHLGVAIHSGRLVFGNIGSSQRMELTVIGDAVNITARLEPLNKEYDTNVILSDTVVKQLDNGFVVRHLDSRLLRGKTEPTELFTLE